MTRTPFTVLLVAALTTAGAVAPDPAPDLHRPGGPPRPVIQVQDLGTLGGATSQAVAVNERGQVIGHSLTATGETHAFLWERGVMRDLGTLGGTWSDARAVNDRGQVVGVSADAAGVSRPFLWDRGRMHQLATPGDVPGSAELVNSRGQVAGQLHGEQWSRAFVWDRGVATDVGQLSDVYPQMFVTDLNDHGWAVGYGYAGPTGVESGWLWRDGTLVPLDAPVPGANSYPVHVDERGRITATATTPGGQVHAATWRLGTWQDLGGIAGESRARAANERGTVVGTAWAGTDMHAALFRDGAVTDLAALAPPGYSEATDVNAREQVVGWVPEGVGSATTVLWQDGRAHALPLLGTADRATARDLNDHGQVAGYVMTGFEGDRAVLWTIR